VEINQTRILIEFGVKAVVLPEKKIENKFQSQSTSVRMFILFGTITTSLELV
jgi:hypothetical protein